MPSFPFVNFEGNKISEFLYKLIKACSNPNFIDGYFVICLYKIFFFKLIFLHIHDN